MNLELAWGVFFIYFAEKHAETHTQFLNSRCGATMGSSRMHCIHCHHSTGQFLPSHSHVIKEGPRIRCPCLSLTYIV